MSDSLKVRTIKGTFWSAADAFLGQGVTFIVGIVLARMLSPMEYGLIGICLIFTTILTGVVDSGFSNALIRKKNVTNLDYNTMFITNMVMSIVIYLLLFLIAPQISVFFSRPQLTELIRAMGGILILQALSIIQITVLTKRLDFRTKTKASLISAILSGLIGIIMAYKGYGVWSLVGQQLSNKLINTVCLWYFNHWCPNLLFSKGSFSYMWGYGWKMMLSGLLNNIWNQLYQVVVGKFYSPTTLGQYSRAKEYAFLLSANTTAIVQRVSLPVLANIQDEKARMLSAYRRMIKITMLPTCIFMLALGAISEPLIYCLIGPQWHEASLYLPLICISMSLYPLHALNLNMLQIQGRSDLFLYIEIVKKVIAVIPLSIGIFIGIYWMLFGSIVAGILSFFLNSYYTGKKLGYSSWRQLVDILPDYFIALIVSVPLYFLKYLPISNYVILIIQLLLALFLCITICEISRLEEYREIKNIIIDVIRKFRNNIVL